MLESPASAEAIKKKAAEKQLVLADETAKKAKAAEVSPIVPIAEKSEEVMIIKVCNKNNAEAILIDEVGGFLVSV